MHQLIDGKDERSLSKVYANVLARLLHADSWVQLLASDFLESSAWNMSASIS